MRVAPTPPSSFTYDLTCKDVLQAGETVSCLPTKNRSVEPAVPTGLNINPASGLISGCANEEATEITYTNDGKVRLDKQGQLSVRFIHSFGQRLLSVRFRQAGPAYHVQFHGLLVRQITGLPMGRYRWFMHKQENQQTHPQTTQKRKFASV